MNKNRHDTKHWKETKKDLISWKLNSQCANCFSTRNLTFHHIIFKSQGGGNEKSNLMILCRKCHDRVHSEEGLYIPCEKTKIYRINDGAFDLLRKLNPKFQDQDIIDNFDVSEIINLDSISM